MRYLTTKATIKIAFPTDEHYPFQDERARSIALAIVEDFRPDVLVTGSDGLDFYSLSSFDKDPARVKAGGLQREIDAWCAGQREWRSVAPDADRIHIPGNHEDRLRRWLWRHPDIADLDALKLSSLLKFDQLGLIEAQEVNFFDRLLVHHGTRVHKNAGASAYAELEKLFFAMSSMTGHTHRGGSVYVTSRTGLVEAHEGFCLCDLEPDYVANPNWQHGILLAEVSADHLQVEPVPFRDYRAYWRGKLYV